MHLRGIMLTTLSTTGWVLASLYWFVIRRVGRNHRAVLSQTLICVWIIQRYCWNAEEGPRFCIFIGSLVITDAISGPLISNSKALKDWEMGIIMPIFQNCFKNYRWYMLRISNCIWYFVVTQWIGSYIGISNFFLCRGRNKFRVCH